MSAAQEMRDIAARLIAAADALDNEEQQRAAGRWQRPVGGCLCGNARQEVTQADDGSFKERTGCMTCNRWDGPAVLNRDNPHPDGCFSGDSSALRDCQGDGHHECNGCTRKEAT